MQPLVRLFNPSRALRSTITACAIAILAAGCGNEPKALPASCVDGECQANNSNGNNNSNNGTNNGDTPADWENLQVNGKISSGQFEQTPVVSLDKNNKILKVRMPMFPNPFLILAGELALPEIPGGKLSMETLPDGSPVLVLKIPLSRLLHGLDFPRKNRLPNGDPLPAVAGGELPSFGITLSDIGQTDATIYLGPSVVALFVNTPFKLPINRTIVVPIFDQKTSKTLGYFGLIPAKKRFDGGFYMSVQLPPEIARIIDDIL